MCGRSPQRHCHWKRRSTSQSHAASPLEVGGDEQGEARPLLQGVELGCDLERWPDGNDDPAHTERVDPHGERVVFLTVERRVVPEKPGHHELPDLLANGK